MGLGPYIVMTWFGIVIASCVIAGIHLWRRHARGLLPAMVAVAGGLLSWALVSAYVGAFETSNYAASTAFFVSVGIGIMGLALVIASGARLKKKTKRPIASGA